MKAAIVKLQNKNNQEESASSANNKTEFKIHQIPGLE